MKQDLVTSGQKTKDLSRFFDVGGKIRLHHVISEVSSEKISNDDLVSVYTTWKNQDEFMCLCRKKKGVLRNVRYGYDFKFVKCSKRGNDVYNWRCKERFAELEALADELGSDFIFNPNDVIKKTNVLFGTHTYDTKRCSASEAWRNVGRDWNRTITRLRKHFDRPIEFLRVWESTKKGYPHIHVMLIFCGKEFEVVEHEDSDNKTSYRLSNDEDRDAIKDAHHSFVDVQGVNSIGGAIRYLVKYLRKEHSVDPDSEEPVKEMQSRSLSLAKMWLHRKRSFAISSGFVEKLKEIRLDQNCAQFKPKTEQVTLDGKKIDEQWHVLRKKIGRVRFAKGYELPRKSVLATFSEKELWRNKNLRDGIEKKNFVLETSNVSGIDMDGCFVS